MIFNMTSGGGSELNFTVKSYATESELLAATPKENTIGIITTTPISSWIFSSTQPETPGQGMVWISTGNSSAVNFNALKKNGVHVYPTLAKQYISGAWVTMEAQIYQSGVWVAFSAARYYIFKSGEGAVVPLKSYKETYATISVGKNNIKTNYSGTVNSYATALRTNEKINLAGYSILKMTCTPSDVLNDDYAVFGLTSTAFTSAELEESVFSTKVSITESSSEKTFSVDISKITSSLYVGFLFAGEMTVTNIWME